MSYRYRYRNTEKRKAKVRELLTKGHKQSYIAFVTSYSQQEVSRIKRAMEVVA